MLQSQRRLFQLTTSTTKKSIVPLLTTVRHNSSSVGNKVQLNNNSTTATVDKDKLNTAATTTPPSNDSFEIEKKAKIPFMPVINIPETEFAHHSFFSLYRPLLGLSDKDETPFFSQKQQKSEEERNQEKMDAMLAVYMSNCVPFVEPQQGIEEWKDDFIQAYDNAENESHHTEVSLKVTTEEFQDFQDLFSEEEQENLILEDYNNKPSLPMFHMPESGDVLDYLTSIESNMKEEHAKLDLQDKLKATRLKKLEIIGGLHNEENSFINKPRFYSSPNRNNIQQRFRRYQLKWMLK